MAKRHQRTEADAQGPKPNAQRPKKSPKRVDTVSDLTDPQLEALQKALREQLVTLKAQMTVLDEGARPVELDQPIGRLSRMSAIQQQKMTEASSRRLGERLRLTVAALGRFSRGDYGYCIECDDPVGYPRLVAQPETSLCLSCQQAREQRGR